MTGPPREGTHNHHGNFIFSLPSTPLPLSPQPHLSKDGAGRGEAGALKTEQRWQLSLQSWWDKVISFHVAAGERPSEATFPFF